MPSGRFTPDRIITAVVPLATVIWILTPAATLRGMTTRDIQAHLAEVYGARVSPALVSRVTDVVHEEITAWQTRPLDLVYPILYIDALVIKVRDAGVAGNKAAHLVLACLPREGVPRRHIDAAESLHRRLFRE